MVEDVDLRSDLGLILRICLSCVLGPLPFRAMGQVVRMGRVVDGVDVDGLGILWICNDVDSMRDKWSLEVLKLKALRCEFLDGFVRQFHCRVLNVSWRLLKVRGEHSLGRPT